MKPKVRARPITKTRNGTVETQNGTWDLWTFHDLDFSQVVLSRPMVGPFATRYFSHLFDPVTIAQTVECPLREQEVMGSIPGRAIPKALKMVPVATLLGAQHYKASTGSSLTHY